MSQVQHAPRKLNFGKAIPRSTPTPTPRTPTPSTPSQRSNASTPTPRPYTPRLLTSTPTPTPTPRTPKNPRPTLPSLKLKTSISSLGPSKLLPTPTPSLTTPSTSTFSTPSTITASSIASKAALRKKGIICDTCYKHVEEYVCGHGLKVLRELEMCKSHAGIHPYFVDFRVKVRILHAFCSGCEGEVRERMNVGGEEGKGGVESVRDEVMKRVGERVRREGVVVEGEGG